MTLKFEIVPDTADLVVALARLNIGCSQVLLRSLDYDHQVTKKALAETPAIIDGLEAVLRAHVERLDG